MVREVIAQYKIRSHSNKELIYTVTKWDNFEWQWGCSCPHWTKRRGDNGSGICKHIREAMPLYAGDNSIREHIQIVSQNEIYSLNQEIRLSERSSMIDIA